MSADGLFLVFSVVSHCKGVTEVYLRIKQSAVSLLSDLRPSGGVSAAIPSDHCSNVLALTLISTLCGMSKRSVFS